MRRSRTLTLLTLIVLTLIVIGGLAMNWHPIGADIAHNSVVRRFVRPIARLLFPDSSPDAADEPGPTWILRESFADGVADEPEPEVLPADLHARLEASGAINIVIEAAGDAVLCRCCVDIPGSAYLRRFECRGPSARLAAQRLLVELRAFAAGQKLSQTP